MGGQKGTISMPLLFLYLHFLECGVNTFTFTSNCMENSLGLHEGSYTITRSYRWSVENTPGEAAVQKVQNGILPEDREH